MMKTILVVIFAVMLCGCKPDPIITAKPKYRTYEITYDNRIDTIIATRCEYAHWTSGGRAIKAFDGLDVIASYGVKKGQSYTIRIINQ